MKNILTITTDFKDQFATGQLHAVLVKNGFKGEIIENHDITPYSTLEGAYAIWQLSKYCPKKTIHLGIVDPGVGSSRDGIIIKTRNFWFIGPNNGLLYPACSIDKIEKVWKIDEKYFGKVSPTFHGRDVFIKSAILISKGINPNKFNSKNIDKSQVIKSSFKKGQIVHIDNYGNLKVWGKPKIKIPLVKTFSDLEIGKPGILLGSSNLFEVFVNQASAKDYFGVKLGEII